MPAKKPSPKPAARKAAPAKAPAKPAKGPRPGKAPAAKPAKEPAPATPAAKPFGQTLVRKPSPPAADADDAPVPVPAPAIAPRGPNDPDVLCHIEILKDGHFFIARTQAEGAPSKEYRNTVFEDMLTEMVITLQEQVGDK